MIVVAVVVAVVAVVVDVVDVVVSNENCGGSRRVESLFRDD